jgi:hypothetical protein
MATLCIPVVGLCENGHTQGNPLSERVQMSTSNAKACSSSKGECCELHFQKSIHMNELVSCNADILQVKGMPPHLKKEN